MMSGTIRMKTGLALAAALTAAILSSAVRAQDNLTTADVDRIISQAVEEAKAQGAQNATIAITDRVGNVLGVYRLGASSAMTVSSARDIPLGNGLDKLPLGTGAPAPLNGIDGAALGAIAKAVTGAYLSSSGNAFTTRTASQIVQEFFNVGERGQPGGPLYGVQFSSLSCSDLVMKGEALGQGPRRSPLGLSADPGGLPLYKGKTVVGGIGVIADATYSLDRDIRDFDRNIDELVAVAGQNYYEPPLKIRAHRIAVGGPTLRYSDVDKGNLKTKPKNAPASPGGGSYITVPGWTNLAGPRAGTAYGDAASGYRRAAATDNGAELAQEDWQRIADVGAFILVDNTNANRFAPRAGFNLAGGSGLQPREVVEILARAYGIASKGRAQIRRPLDSFIQVTISVVDVQGRILGVIRTPDAPVFGTDVSLQKARSATFFSRPDAGQILSNSPAAAILSLIPVTTGAAYVQRFQSFMYPQALADGIAYGARSIGNVHRPFFPDGVDKQKMTGPLSTSYDTWSPFNVGLQLDLVFQDIVRGINPATTNTFAPGSACAFNSFFGDATNPNVVDANGNPLLGNGLQIFAGGVPIFRGSEIVGGIGISGDGIDQDDMIAFLGADKAGEALSEAFGNAPNKMRINHLTIKNTSLRYVACPFAPFTRSRSQEPCRGK